MARPDGWRLDPANYPVTAEVQTRFGDMDVLGHLNNVAYAALFENGRVVFNRAITCHPHRGQGIRWLVASVAIDYLAEGHFPAPVTIASGVGDIGRTSWQIFQAGFQGGQCIALCRTTLVQADSGGSLAIDDALRAELTRLAVRR